MLGECQLCTARRRAAEQIQRLSAFALVAGVLWAVGLLMDGVIFPLAIGAPVTPAALFVEACGVVAAIATFAWVRYSAALPRTSRTPACG